MPRASVQLGAQEIVEAKQSLKGCKSLAELNQIGEAIKHLGLTGTDRDSVGAVYLERKKELENGN